MNHEFKIAIYKLEVDWFCASAWDDKCIEISAISKIQLMKTFLHETQWCGCKNGMTIKETQRSIWNNHKQYLEETTLSFPIIS